MLSREEEISLVRRAKEGSNEAIGDLFERVGGKLHALIRSRMSGNLDRRVDAEDVLQNTMLKAFDNIDRFDGSGPTTLLGWMAIIANNEVRDQARFHKRDRRDIRQNTAIATKHNHLAEQIRSQTSLLMLKQRSQQLDDALKKLEPDHREVILLRKFEDLSFKEIGDRMGRTSDASRMLLARAMTRLTSEMGTDLP